MFAIQIHGGGGGGDDKYIVNVSGAPILPGQITFIQQKKHCKKSQLNSSSLFWLAQRQATQHDCLPRVLGNRGLGSEIVCSCNVTVVYMAREVMILMLANTIRGPLEGVGLVKTA